MAQILLPIGRLVGGSVHQLVQEKKDGKPIFKDDGVTPVTKVNFGVAIPKNGETHWKQTPWGSQIFHIGEVGHGNLTLSPAFSWKIIDGDSQVPNKQGKVPSTREGYPGHWVLWFSQGWAPKLVDATGAHVVPADAFKTGYYVQVLADVEANKIKQGQTPSVYLNPKAVALSGEGQVIQGSTDVDTTSVGFGGALPAGAAPITRAEPAFATAPVAPVAPIAPTPVAAPVAPAPVAAPPDPNFLKPSGPQMTAKATATYDAYIQSNWTDALLREHGLMV